MPTNANVFNSRVTSEALEAKFRQVFPAQGGAELVQDLFASGVIQPVVDFSTVAEGSILPQNLQTAWDYSTGSQATTSSTSDTIITNPGFWQIGLTASGLATAGPNSTATIAITDGITPKNVWGFSKFSTGVSGELDIAPATFVVFLRAGDSVVVTAGSDLQIDSWYRQIADVNGTLVNPLGFTFS